MQCSFTPSASRWLVLWSLSSGDPTAAVADPHAHAFDGFLQRKRVDESSSDTSSDGEADKGTVKRERVKVKKEKREPEEKEAKADKTARKLARKARKAQKLQLKPTANQTPIKLEKATENLLPKWFLELPASWKVLLCLRSPIPPLSKSSLYMRDS